MGKIIKYEWKKQRTSRFVILFGLLACLILFTIGAINQNSTSFFIAVMLMTFGSFLVIFYTGIESLIVFNRDLRTKQSHMLWMIPKSVYEILGGKFLAAILQMLFVFTAFLLTGCLSMLIMFFGSDGKLNQLIEFFQNLVLNMFQVKIDWGMFLSIMFLLFLSWTVVIMTGFLAIIISRTVLLNSRFSGILSIILFFIINYIVEEGYSLLSNAFGLSGFTFQFLDFAYYIVACVALFLASGVLANKKLSV